MILYKYMPEPHSLLDEGYIRATQLSALNDPFEATFCKEGIERIYDSTNILVPFEQVVRHIQVSSQRVGVISFTEAKDNLLMWSHYANDHKGIAVGIDSRNLGANGIFESLFIPVYGDEYYRPYSTEIHSISYRKLTRYRTDYLDYDFDSLTKGGFLIEFFVFDVFKQKSDEWIYEKEHRSILALEQAERVIFHDFDDLDAEAVRLLKEYRAVNERKFPHPIVQIDLFEITDIISRTYCAFKIAEFSFNPDNVYLFKIGNNKIVSLIEGYRCDENYSDMNINFARSNPALKIWETHLDRNHYTLKFKEAPPSGDQFLKD